MPIHRRCIRNNRIEKAKHELEEILKPSGYTVSWILDEFFHFTVRNPDTGKEIGIFSQTRLSFKESLIGRSAYVLFEEEGNVYCYNHDAIMKIFIENKKGKKAVGFDRLGLFTQDSKHVTEVVWQALEKYIIIRRKLAS